MEYIGAEVSHKIRSAIKAKLMELGAHIDEELPDYIMVMVANKRAKAQMDGDLQLFLGDNTSQFTSWLYQVLQKLQEVTVGNLDKKPSKISSSVMKDTSSAKRKSSSEVDSHRKEKRRKSSESRKVKKSDLEVQKDNKKDNDGGSKSSSKLSDPVKFTQSHPTKEFVSSSRSETSDSVVSSSADSKSNRKLVQKEKGDKTQDSDSSKRNSAKVSLSNGNSKSEEKNYLSRLRAEALRSRDERMAALKLSGTSNDLRPFLSSKDENENKPVGTKAVYAQPPQRTKIVLMNSDDDDEDEDFINIKADAEAEQLLQEELPREVLETNVSTPETPAMVEHVEDQKKTPEGPALPPPPEHPTIPLKENLVPKRPCVKEVSNPQKNLNSATLSAVPLELPSIPVPSRLLRKRPAESEADAVRSKIVKEEDKPAGTALSIKDRLGVKKQMVPIVKREQDCKVTTRLGVRHVSTEQTSDLSQEELEDNGETVKKRTSSSSSILSRVVMMRDHPRPERCDRIGENRGIKPNEDEEEEYDPSNPAVGTVASIVRVKPRPKLPPSLQANKNLILKAVAEAQKSVISAPVRPEPARSPGLWKRTSAGFVRKLENNVAVALPNRSLQSYKEPDDGLEDIKPDSTRLVSSGNGHDKIIIKVSSTKADKVEDEEVSLLPQRTEDTSDDENVSSVLQFQEEEHVSTEETDTVGSGRSVYPPVGLASRMPCERSTQQQQQFGSPQFLVTLDGLDPEMFGSRSASLDEQAANKEDFDMENLEASGSSENDTPKKAKTPIVYKVESTEESTEPSTLPKSLERCKYWPSCKLGVKCNFHHPQSPCKTFPKCPFGDKCLYIHPFCKFNSACTRRDCPFVHAAPRPLVSSVPRSSAVSRSTFTPICRFFPKCSNVSCRFLHPKACRYGKYCSKQDCNYIHQDLPSVDKLKWTSPFKI